MDLPELSVKQPVFVSSVVLMMLAGRLILQNRLGG